MMGSRAVREGMAMLLSICAVTCLVLALAIGVSTSSVSAAPAKKGDAVKGKKIFTTYCVACHGASGKGDGVASSALNPKPRDFSDGKVMKKVTDKSMFEIVEKGGAAVGRSPMMTPWGAVLKAQDIEDVVAYIRTFSVTEKK